MGRCGRPNRFEELLGLGETVLGKRGTSASGCAG